jgi:hypothetical protein
MTDPMTWMAPDDDPTFGASTACRAAGLDQHSELAPWEPGVASPQHDREAVAGLLAMLDCWRHKGTRPRTPQRPMFGSSPAAYNGGPGDYSAGALSLLV